MVSEKVYMRQLSYRKYSRVKIHVTQKKCKFEKEFVLKLTR